MEDRTRRNCGLDLGGGGGEGEGGGGGGSRRNRGRGGGGECVGRGFGGGGVVFELTYAVNNAQRGLKSILRLDQEAVSAHRMRSKWLARGEEEGDEEG